MLYLFIHQEYDDVDIVGIFTSKEKLLESAKEYFIKGFSVKHLFPLFTHTSWHLKNLDDMKLEIDSKNRIWINCDAEDPKNKSKTIRIRDYSDYDAEEYEENTNKYGYYMRTKDE